MVESSRLKTTSMEPSVVDGADDGLATIERLVPMDAMPMVMASLDVNRSYVLEAVSVASSVVAIVLSVSDGPARHTTDQTADGGTSDGPIAAASDQPTDDGSSDRSIASPTLSKVLGLGIGYHHEKGGDCEGSVFDHVHCFDFRWKLLRGDAGG
jgi:hypothetical protein